MRERKKESDSRKKKQFGGQNKISRNFSFAQKTVA